jgi:hypothetical protein
MAFIGFRKGSGVLLANRPGPVNFAELRADLLRTPNGDQAWLLALSQPICRPKLEIIFTAFALRLARCGEVAEWLKAAVC